MCVVYVIVHVLSVDSICGHTQCVYFCKGHFSVSNLSLLSFVKVLVCVCIVTIIYNKSKTWFTLNEY